MSLTLTGKLLTMGLVMGSCAKQADVSRSKIVNGTMAFYFEQPAIITLYDENLDAICTGTFISETQVLTAAHCTEANDVDPNTGEVGGKLSIVFIDDLASHQAKVVATSTKIVRNPLWDAYGSGVNSADLAIITFPKGTWKTKAKISKRQAQVGDEIELYGYGLNQDDDSSDISSAGVFRKGFNTIDTVDGGFIGFLSFSYNESGDGSYASSGQGDSGGPLFVNEEIVGVVSGGRPPSSYGDDSYNYYVDLHSKVSQAFLDYAITR